MARTAMHRSDSIQGEAECGRADARRRLEQAPNQPELTPPTLPPPHHHEHSPAQTNLPRVQPQVQPTTPFLNLALETRHQIYRYLIHPPEAQFRILQTPAGKLGYMRCLDCYSCDHSGHGCWETSNKNVSRFWAWPILAPAIWECHHASRCVEPGWEWMEESERFGDLLGTCWQVYREMREITYGEYTFVFENLYTVMDFSRSLGDAGCWDLIREMQLDLQSPNRRVQVAFQKEITQVTGETIPVAEQAFGCIGRMRGLRKLRVEWDFSEYPGDRRWRVELMRPLCGVKQVGDFVVVAPLDWVPGREELGELPFRYEEVEDGSVINDDRGPTKDDPDGIDPEGYGLEDEAGV